MKTKKENLYEKYKTQYLKNPTDINLVKLMLAAYGIKNYKIESNDEHKNK